MFWTNAAAVVAATATQRLRKKAGFLPALEKGKVFAKVKRKYKCSHIAGH